jgi:3-methyladenine DNA glycosylase AlkD
MSTPPSLACPSAYRLGNVADMANASLLDDLGRAFAAHRDVERARGMSAYVRGQFTYFGLAAPTQRAIARDVLAKHDVPDEAALRRIVLDCWERPEREWQYFACDLLARRARHLTPRFLPTAKKLVSTKSWWDTVDSLATKTVGGLVRAHPELAGEMDRWIESPNIWLARTAILHQLSYKKDTDADRLFAYCAKRAGDEEFFIRKAIGWALREYTKTDEAAVHAFLAAHDAELSGLSKREAVKWLTRRRAR